MQTFFCQCPSFGELYAYDASLTNFVFVIMLFEQSREPATATSSSQAPITTRSQGQVANDAKVMEYMKAKFVRMEQDLKDA